MSSLSASFCFSVLAADLEDSPKLDQNEVMPDITLRRLDTECMESRSELRTLFRWAWLRKDTYSAGAASVCMFSKRTFMGPMGTLSSSKRDSR